MKVIHLYWTAPDGSPVQEELPEDRFKLSWDHGVLKIHDNELSRTVRYVPTHAVRVVQFIEKEEPSRLVTPGPGPVAAVS